MWVGGQKLREDEINRALKFSPSYREKWREEKLWTFNLSSNPLLFSLYFNDPIKLCFLSIESETLKMVSLLFFQQDGKNCIPFKNMYGILEKAYL